MSVVISRSAVPNVRCVGGPAPVEVFFKRRVKWASVAAAGDEEVAGRGSLSSSVGSRASQGIPVKSMLGALCNARQCVGSVASRLPVEPSLTASVASASPLRLYPTVRLGPPASTLPLVLRSLRRRAAAAKVLRGRRRLGMAAASDLSQRPSVASVGLFPLRNPARFVEFGQSVFSRELSSPVASASFVPVSPKLSAQNRTLQ